MLDDKIKKRLLFAINVDWYFDLHWQERIFSEMTSDFHVSISYAITLKNETHHPSNTQILPLNIKRSSINPLSNIVTLFKASRIIRQNSFDLIHAVTIKPNLYFGLLAKLHSLPILITIPGLGTAFSSKGFKYLVLRKLIRLIYRFVGSNRKVYFVFENTQDKDHFLENKICSSENSSVVAGAGVDLEKFKYTEEIETDSEPVKVLFAARLLKGKGLGDLIKAIKLVNVKKHQVNLYVAGITDTDSREAIPLAQIKQWQTNGEINYLGQVENMTKLLSEIHILALPTKYGEGIPRILMEANACGRPIIATDVAGCNEFITDGLNGLLVSPGKIDELAKAIERLLDQNWRRKMGQAGRQKVESKYTREHIIKEYKAIYKKIAYQRHR